MMFPDRLLDSYRGCGPGSTAMVRSGKPKLVRSIYVTLRHSARNLSTRRQSRRRSNPSRRSAEFAGVTVAEPTAPQRRLQRG
jgi:hypothetical protein